MINSSRVERALGFCFKTIPVNTECSLINDTNALNSAIVFGKGRYPKGVDLSKMSHAPFNQTAGLLYQRSALDYTTTVLSASVASFNNSTPANITFPLSSNVYAMWDTGAYGQEW